MIIEIKFKGIDDFNRPVFKDVNYNWYYGSMQTLFPNTKLFPNNTIEELIKYFKEHINELEYFGNSFNCEPHGGLSSTIELKIVDI